MNDKRSTPRAIKLTTSTIEVITGQGMRFDLPPQVDHLLDAVTTPGDVDYYFVTDYPGVTDDKAISWALVPDFMFENRFKFATKPSDVRLVSIIEKE